MDYFLVVEEFCAGGLDVGGASVQTSIWVKFYPTTVQYNTQVYQLKQEHNAAVSLSHTSYSTKKKFIGYVGTSLQ